MKRIYLVSQFSLLRKHVRWYLNKGKTTKDSLRDHVTVYSLCRTRKRILIQCFIGIVFSGDNVLTWYISDCKLFYKVSSKTPRSIQWSCVLLSYSECWEIIRQMTSNIRVKTVGKLNYHSQKKFQPKGIQIFSRHLRTKNFYLSSFGSKYFRLEQDCCVWVIISKEKNGINHINIYKSYK